MAKSGRNRVKLKREINSLVVENIVFNKPMSCWVSTIKSLPSSILGIPVGGSSAGSWLILRSAQNSEPCVGLSTELDSSLQKLVYLRWIIAKRLLSRKKESQSEISGKRKKFRCDNYFMNPSVSCKIRVARLWNLAPKLSARLRQYCIVARWRWIKIMQMSTVKTKKVMKTSVVAIWLEFRF